MSQSIVLDSMQQNPSSSAEIIGHNEDILTKILLNIPSKPLTSFNLVSNQWLSLISSPRFLRRYTLLHPPLLSGLFLVSKNRNMYDENQMEYISLNQNRSSYAPVNPFSNFRNVKILQSCNGLVLFCTMTKTQYGFCRSKVISCHEQEFYVFNPTTQKSVLVPRCPNQMVGQDGLELSFSSTNSPCYTLVFDGTNSPHYKIVCVRKIARDYHKIAMYSSDSKLWRLSNAPDFSAPRDIDFTGGVYCNGAVHWTKRTFRGLYFDVENEVINHMPELPRKEQYSCEYFGHSRGYLHCVFTMEGLHHYELFEMERDYSTWFLKFKIELDSLAFNFPKMAKEINYQNPMFKYQCQVLSVLRGRNGKVVKIILSIPGEVIAYNCKKNTSWKICESRLGPKDKRLWYGVYDVYEYFETLSLVNGLEI